MSAALTPRLTGNTIIAFSDTGNAADDEIAQGISPRETVVMAGFYADCPILEASGTLENAQFKVETVLNDEKSGTFKLTLYRKNFFYAGSFLLTLKTEHGSLNTPIHVCIYGSCRAFPRWGFASFRAFDWKKIEQTLKCSGIADDSSCEVLADLSAPELALTAKSDLLTRHYQLSFGGFPETPGSFGAVFGFNSPECGSLPGAVSNALLLYNIYWNYFQTGSLVRVAETIRHGNLSGRLALHGKYFRQTGYPYLGGEFQPQSNGSWHRQIVWDDSQTGERQILELLVIQAAGNLWQLRQKDPQQSQWRTIVSVPGVVLGTLTGKAPPCGDWGSGIAVYGDGQLFYPDLGIFHTLKMEDPGGAAQLVYQGKAGLLIPGTPWQFLASGSGKTIELAGTPQIPSGGAMPYHPARKGDQFAPAELYDESGGIGGEDGNTEICWNVNGTVQNPACRYMLCRTIEPAAEVYADMLVEEKRSSNFESATVYQSSGSFYYPADTTRYHRYCADKNRTYRENRQQEYSALWQERFKLNGVMLQGNQEVQKKGFLQEVSAVDFSSSAHSGYESGNRAALSDTLNRISSGSITSETTVLEDVRSSYSSAGTLSGTLTCVSGGADVWISCGDTGSPGKREIFSGTDSFISAAGIVEFVRSDCEISGSSRSESVDSHTGDWQLNSALAAWNTSHLSGYCRNWSGSDIIQGGQLVRSGGIELSGSAYFWHSSETRQQVVWSNTFSGAVQHKTNPATGIVESSGSFQYYTSSRTDSRLTVSHYPDYSQNSASSLVISGGGTLISGTWNNSGASFTSVTEPLCRNENGVLTVTEGSSSSWVASGGAEEYFASCQAQYLSQVRENRRALEQWQSLGGENLYSEVYYTSNGVESSDERTFSAETE